MTKRNAFTLVELIISIFLLSIIVMFLYATVSNLEQTNKIFTANEKKQAQREKIIDLLYNDIFSADSLTLQGDKETLASMQTKNSLFDISKPYVTWLVSREKKTLLRFESTMPFQDMTSQNSAAFHISKVGEACEIFKIYQSKQKENILLHIQFKEELPMVYEFSKPLHETNSTNNTTQQNTQQTPIQKSKQQIPGGPSLPSSL